MRYVNRLALALATAFMLVLATTISASALPDISLTLSGATYPDQMSITALTVKTKIADVAKNILKGEGVLLVAYLNELGHLGTYEALLTKVEKESTLCFSEEGGKKDSSGEVLTRGTWHLVYTSLAGSPQGLQLGLLALTSPVTVKCGSSEVMIKGDGLGSVDTLTGGETEEYTQLGGVVKGNGEGTPNIRFFYNEAGTGVKAKTEVNFGTGFKEAAEEDEESVAVTGAEGKMIVITSR